VTELVTHRLQLRQWQDADLVPFAALNADPEVMRFFPDRLTRAQSDQFATKIRATIDRQGWGLWAVGVAEGPSFIGFVGLSRPRFRAHFTPAVEVGWRLARSHWGNGYATEAASAAVSFGFEQLRLEEIVSFTSAINERSIGVMRRIGMTYDPADDFDHPDLPDGPLRRHVLYRIANHIRIARTQPSWRPENRGGDCRLG
jgi:RimJ/RimL family protein N-acetyltransferase